MTLLKYQRRPILFHEPALQPRDFNLLSETPQWLAQLLYRPQISTLAKKQVIKMEGEVKCRSFPHMHVKILVLIILVQAILGSMVIFSENTEGADWNPSTIDPNPGVGLYNALAIDSANRPHVAYSDDINFDLKYANLNGTSWNITTVDSTGSVGNYTSIAIGPDDTPHIAYYDHTNRDLKYAHWNGTGWDIVVVDSSGNVGTDTAIAVNSSNVVHILYTDWSVEDLNHAMWDGQDWSLYTVETAGGRYPSIRLTASGEPRISYLATVLADLKYARWTGSGWSKTVVDSDGITGSHPSLVLDGNGYPHITYCDSTDDYIRYAYNLGSGWKFGAIQSNPSICGDIVSSLEIDSFGNMYVAYAKPTGPFPTPYNLAHAKKLGASSWSSVTVDTNILAPAMRIDSLGRHHLIYCKVSESTLKYAFWNPAPSSSVDSLPSFSTEPVLQLNATVTEGTDIQQVELFYRYESGLWQSWGNDSVAPWNWTFNTTAVSGDGRYEFYSIAVDGEGIIEPAPATCDAWTVVDTQPPLSEVLIPEDGEVLVSLPIPEGNASDAGSGISIIELSLQRLSDGWFWNGTTWNSSLEWLLTSGIVEWNYTGQLPPLENDVDYQLCSRATDNASLIQPTPSCVSLTGDLAPPTVTITDPTDGQFLSTDSITVVGTASDNQNVTKVKVRINGGVWQNASGTFSWSFSAVLPAEINLVEAQSFDAAGNPSLIDQANVTVDQLAPSVSISDPMDGQTITTTPISISGTSSDAGASGLQRVELRLNQGVTWMVATGTSSWTVSVDLVSGSNTVEARAWDNASNPSTTISITVLFIPPDVTPPEISNLQPADGSTVGDGFPTISAGYDDLSGIDTANVLIRVDDIDVTSSATVTSAGVSYTPTSSLSEGVHNVYLEVEDDSSEHNMATKSWSFTVDLPDEDGSWLIEMLPWIVLGFAVVFISIAVLILLYRKRKTGELEPPEDDQISLE